MASAIVDAADRDEFSVGLAQQAMRAILMTVRTIAEIDDGVARPAGTETRIESAIANEGIRGLSDGGHDQSDGERAQAPTPKGKCVCDHGADSR